VIILREAARRLNRLTVAGLARRGLFRRSVCLYRTAQNYRGSFEQELA
jgi:hypothetical protein